jgi:hypothetical protein
MLDKEIKDKQILDLTKQFISVFGNGVSLGLGSQVSQIAAIFYPSLLDHYIKEVLRIKYYGRYMDDLYLIHKDKEFLKGCLAQIKEMCNTLKITINNRKTKIVALDKGVMFLKGKYSLLGNSRVLRRPCKGSAVRMRRKLRKLKVLLNEGKVSFEDVRCAYQSWRGNYKKRFNAYHQIRFMDKMYNDLFR